MRKSIRLFLIAGQSRRWFRNQKCRALRSNENSILILLMTLKKKFDAGHRWTWKVKVAVILTGNFTLNCFLSYLIASISPGNLRSQTSRSPHISGMTWDKLSPVKTVGMATSVPSSQASPALVNALFERVEEQAEVRTFTTTKNNDNDNNNGNNHSGRPSLRLDNIKIIFSTCLNLRYCKTGNKKHSTCLRCEICCKTIWMPMLNMQRN